MNDNKLKKGHIVIETNYTYRKPDGDQPERHDEIRDMAKGLAYLIMTLCPDSREKSLAFTNLEQAVMWAIESITRNE